MVRDLTDNGDRQPKSGTDILNPLVGAMLIWPRNAALPPGWIPCDGRCYLSSDFPILHSYFQANRAPNDPLNSFRVPHTGNLIPPHAIVQLIIFAG